MEKKQLVMFDNVTQSLDVTLCENLEIRIRYDGKVLWVSDSHRCILRICQIQGEITIEDERIKMPGE